MTWEKIKSLYEPRYLQPMAVSYYFLVYMLYLDGDRSITSLIVMVFYSLLLDMILKYLVTKKFAFSLPGITTAIATILLMKTPQLDWPYYMAITAGLLSKQLLKDKYGHYFNPAAIGILAVVLIFPEYALIQLRQWAISPIFYLTFIIAGFSVTVLNRKYVLSLTYLSLIMFLRFLWSKWMGLSLLYGMGSVVSMAIIIFSFHMITDPKTSPKSHLGQFYYGAIIALIDFAFRWGEVPNSALISICLVCAIINPFKEKFTVFKCA